MKVFWRAVLILGLAIGCAPRHPELIRNPEEALRTAYRPQITDDGDAASLAAALEQSIRYYERVPADREFIFGPRRVSAADQAAALKRVRDELTRRGLNGDFYNWLNDEFEILESASKKVLYTGYFEARLRGSLKKTSRYRYPLYGVPPDLLSIPIREFLSRERYPDLPDHLRGRFVAPRLVMPYWTRDEIDYEGKLAGKGLEIAWVDDPLDVFFLHVQGSGVIETEGGKKIRVNYADKNGQAYKAIAGLLIKKGVLTRETASMQSIRAYLKGNPDELREVLSYNPSYVFFRTLKEGPVGSIGVPLTPNRSIATDNALFPQGALALIRSERPVFGADGSVDHWEPSVRLVLNQDTGGAIKGVDHVDLFTGMGEQAELAAGQMRQQGRLYFLAPRVREH